MTYDEDGFRRYLEERESAPGTVYGYVMHCREYFRTHDSLTTADLISYKSELCAKWRPSTVNNHISALMAYARYKNIDAKIKRLRLARRSSVENVIDMKNYKKLLSGLKRDGDKRGYVTVIVLAKTGTRISEAIRITKADVMRGSVEMFTKGKMRKIIIPENLKKDLSERLSEIGENDTLIENSTCRAATVRRIQYALKRYAVRYNIPEKYMHPHAFRHFFAINVLKNCRNVSLLADLLGHTNINTTMIYTRMSETQQRNELDNAINW